MTKVKTRSGIVTSVPGPAPLQPPTTRVWLLGAGFSRPLGGPLLADLFSMRSWQILRVRAPRIFGTPNLALAKVYSLYHFGTNYQEGYCFNHPPKGDYRGERLFDHAEDFLVKLEEADKGWLHNALKRARNVAVVAMSESNPKRYSLPVGSDSVELALGNSAAEPNEVSTKVLLAMARRIVAAECQVFLKAEEDIDLQERFIPFSDWSDHLDDGDAIITFNYDRVVESLFKNPDELTVLTEPNQDYITEKHRQVFLMKMHGSVDWSVSGGRIEKGQSLDLESEEYDPLIAIPGRSKHELTNQYLEPIWDHAKDALRTAGVVNILGYGMPESDAKARRHLLSSLAANRQAKLDINIVLGMGNPQAERLEQTLRQALSHRGTGQLSIDVRQQYAQDFIAGFAAYKSERIRAKMSRTRPR